MTVGSAIQHSNRALKQTSANMPPPIQAQPNLQDAIVTVPLNLDRLRCAVLALCDLLTYAFLKKKFDSTVSSVDIRSPTARAVQLPLGALVSFSEALLSCTCDDDKVRRSSVTWTRPLRV
jgi:hypothetical protein